MRRWLRQFALENPKLTGDVMALVFNREFNKFIKAKRVRELLREAGLSRSAIETIAKQRSRPGNLRYARDFIQHVQRFSRPAWQDEMGINKHGMGKRRNKGWGVEGDGRAYRAMDLRDWPHDNITVMALFDRDAFFHIDVHAGGTDGDYCDRYYTAAAAVVGLRGNDAIIVDNCPAHRMGHLLYVMNRVGIAVVSLPVYWPQWNPEEVGWNTIKDFVQPRLPQLKRDPRGVIYAGANTVTPTLARSFIRHCRVFPPAWHQ